MKISVTQSQGVFNSSCCTNSCKLITSKHTQSRKLPESFFAKHVVQSVGHDDESDHDHQVGAAPQAVALFLLLILDHCYLQGCPVDVVSGVVRGVVQRRYVDLLRGGRRGLVQRGLPEVLVLPAGVIGHESDVLLAVVGLEAGVRVPVDGEHLARVVPRVVRGCSLVQLARVVRLHFAGVFTRRTASGKVWTGYSPGSDNETLIIIVRLIYSRISDPDR